MFGMGLNLGFGDSARSAGGGGPTEEEDMATLTKIITLAELQALGGVDSANLPMDGELPAGSYPVALHARNLGTAFTGANVSGLFVSIANQTDFVPNMHIANNAGRARLLDGFSSTGGVALWPHNGGTPLLSLAVDGGADFVDLTGGDDGIEVVLVYAKKTE
jgi:hypothetical protein